MSSCISGWCMLNGERAVIEDIYQDSRLPHEAYRPTFVRSMAMVPIRGENPIGAIGSYWGRRHRATDEQLAVLDALGGSASMTFANIQLIELLNDASRRKDDFIAMLGHELRNPLAPMRNAVYLLRSSPGANTDRALETLDRQLRHLVHIVDDLLDVSRIAGGRIALNKKLLDLSKLLRDCSGDRQSALKETGLSFELKGLDAPIWLRADETRLTQIFGNLFDNAVKFSTSGGKVLIEAFVHSDVVHVTIQDSGIGIEQPMLSHLFEAFSQADRTLDRAKGGLGLAVVRGLVELYGGKIEAESKGIGLGAKFTVSFPVSDETRARSTVETKGPGIPKDALCRVLVIEAHPDTADGMREMLELAGYDASVAYDGKTDVTVAQRSRPHVIVCDLGLPGIDGFEVATILRRMPELSETVLIAVTGYGRTEDRDRALRSGFDRHLLKPVEPEHLLAEIRSVAQSLSLA